MQYPFFFIEEIPAAKDFITLNEETSKHMVQSLRMKIGETILLTDGKGNLLTCEINDDHKKKCVVKVMDAGFKPQTPRKISIAISLLKNVNRFEWFLEKATELGVSEISPIICARTEKLHFRTERMRGILISAMLQSQQCWLPMLKEPIALNQIVLQSNHSQKFIAHCMKDAKVSLVDAENHTASSQIILIGPEGDFTKEEIDFAFQHHFVPVTLGENRLRTETAGMVAATILAIK